MAALSVELMFYRKRWRGVGVFAKEGGGGRGGGREVVVCPRAVWGGCVSMWYGGGAWLLLFIHVVL